MDFQLVSRSDLLRLSWTRPDGSLALFAFGSNDLWNERSGAEWLAHLGQTISNSLEPVAGMPGPLAHLISGFRLSVQEYWRVSESDPRLAVEAVAVYHDAGRLYFVTAGACRLFRDRNRQEIFLIEAPYSQQDHAFQWVDRGDSHDVVQWGQDLPRPGDSYQVSLGVEEEPAEGLRDFLMENSEDPARLMQYCRAAVRASLPANQFQIRDDVLGSPVPRRATGAILASGASPPPPIPILVGRVGPAPAVAPTASRPGSPAGQMPSDPDPASEPETGGNRRFRPASALGLLALLVLASGVAYLSLGGSRLLRARRPALLHVDSDPRGARVTVDGREVGMTPVEMRVPAGVHLVEARLGVLGQDSSTVRLAGGDTVRFTPRFVGGIALQNLHPGMRLFAQLDGGLADSVPANWSEIPVGRHLVSFSGPGVLSWTAEVQVINGKVSSYSAEPQTTSSNAQLLVTSGIMTDAGLKEARGDVVYVDGAVAGRTPFQGTYEVGPHSVRILRPGQSPQTQLVDLKPGQQRFVRMEFNGAPHAQVELAPPFGSPAYPLIAAVFRPARHEVLKEIRLYYARPGETAFVRRAMTLLDRDRGVYAAPLPPLDSAHARWRYYVEAVDSDFNLISSDVLIYARETPLARGPAGATD